jgi:hypothetical protein
MLYVVPWFATFLAMTIGSVPGSGLGVNPPYTAWIFVVITGLFHAAVMAAIAMRYLAIAGEVPDTPVRAAPARPTPRARSSRPRR